MTIIRPDSLPRLWWLFPWSIARQLHKNAVALKAYGDRADRAIEMQIRIIDNYRKEADELRRYKEMWHQIAERRAVEIENLRIAAYNNQASSGKEGAK